VLAVPASALPICTQVVLVPVLVAPRGWHWQDPLWFDDVELADHAVEGGARDRRLGCSLARLAHGLFQRAVPLLRLDRT
jgi:hypothetical protein